MTQRGFQRIFISYACKDAAELALRLQKDLKAAGFDVWLDTQRIDGGASWTVEIERAIDRAQVVLAILTRGAYESDICRAQKIPGSSHRRSSGGYCRIGTLAGFNSSSTKSPRARHHGCGCCIPRCTRRARRCCARSKATLLVSVAWR